MRNSPESTPSEGATPPAARLAALLTALRRPIGLLGYGEEGRLTARFLLAHGVRELAIFDRAYREDDELDSATRGGLTIHSGEGYARDLARCGAIFRSPGVRPDLPELERARRAGAVITSATRFFLAACPARTVGVTGTVGKGTTVALIGEALRAGGIPHRLGGNLGTNPLAFLDELTPDHVAVLELSSFQLMDLEVDHPAVAVVLRTSVEHLDWHRDAAEYRRAKRGLIAPDPARQHLICCADSEGGREIAGERLGSAETVSLAGPVREGIGYLDGRPHRFRGGKGAPLPALEHLALPGRFNRENAAAALLAAERLGVEPERAAEAIAAFRGLPHRLESVGWLREVECVNDSYATRPEATLGAVEHYQERPLALILGGSEKHADFAPLMEGLCRHPTLCRVLFIGATAERMAAELVTAARRLGRSQPPHARLPDLERAFAAALEALPRGGVALLSPACASFGLFPNYKVRGERFRALVAAAQGGDTAAPRPTG